MKTFKGTKGNWQKTNENTKMLGIFKLDGNVISNIARLDARQVITAEDHANFKLIAAAPELLEALQESNEWLKKLLPFISEEMNEAWKHGIDKNEKAINKALGNENKKN